MTPAPLARWAVALALAGACTRPAPPDVRVALHVLPSPPVVGTASVDLTLSDAAGNPVRGARVSVQGTMSHPGMVPSSAGAAEVAPGRYRASLELTMAGDWYLIVAATLAGGGSIEQTIALPAVRPR